jgi:hypothetical protein
MYTELYDPPGPGGWVMAVVMRQTDRAWVEHWRASGGAVSEWGLDLSVTDSTRFDCCFMSMNDGVLYCTSEPIVDSLPTWEVDARVSYDGAGRLGLVYAAPGRLAFMLRSNGAWEEYPIETPTGEVAVDFVFGTDGQPIVAWHEPNGRVVVARGVDVVGVGEATESRTTDVTPKRPVVIRGVLTLPTSGVVRGASSLLLDATGRKVMDLKAGENDVNGLAPGVYFVVTPHPGPLPQGERERLSALSKVIIAR